MPWQLNCHDMCKIMTWLDHYNQNQSKQNHHKISIMSYILFMKCFGDPLGGCVCIAFPASYYPHWLYWSLWETDHLPWSTAHNGSMESELSEAPVFGNMVPYNSGINGNCILCEILSWAGHHKTPYAPLGLCGQLVWTLFEHVYKGSHHKVFVYRGRKNLWCPDPVSIF